MSDWIDNLRKQEGQQKEAVARFDAVRLHNAKVIGAKSPALWDALIAQIGADLTRLREAFPNDIKWHFDLIQRGHVYTLQSKTFPISSIQLTLNLDAGYVEVSQGLKRSRTEQPVLLPKESIAFVLTNDEEVAFSWKSDFFTDPALLAEQLIKSVCRLPDERVS